MRQRVHDYNSIQGTSVVDGQMAARRYELNKMSFSLNDVENRAGQNRHVLESLHVRANIYDESANHRNYHIPISNTAAATMTLETGAGAGSQQTREEAVACL